MLKRLLGGWGVSFTQMLRSPSKGLKHLACVSMEVTITSKPGGVIVNSPKSGESKRNEETEIFGINKYWYDP
jgi:hypothetical protein